MFIRGEYQGDRYFRIVRASISFFVTTVFPAQSISFVSKVNFPYAFDGLRFARGTLAIIRATRRNPASVRSMRLKLTYSAPRFLHLVDLSQVITPA